MIAEKKKYYDMITDLLFWVHRAIYGDNAFMRKEEITDRKNRILVKEYGPMFSRENILFVEKFLIFAPSFVVTHDSMHSYGFDKDNVPDRILNFRDITAIIYNLMPCQTSIQIVTRGGSKKEVFNGVPDAETYADVKSYERSVQSGRYKGRTIWFLSCIYALTAMYKCRVNEVKSTYESIERNLKGLVRYLEDNEDTEKKYGRFFSFDFVTCEYNPTKVEEALIRIDSAKEEIHELETLERREQFERTLARKMEEARNQYENQKGNN